MTATQILIFIAIFLLIAITIHIIGEWLWKRGYGK